ncbi:MAG TPA: hypothetical protein VGQ83_31100 [Polyangia bacterium]
MRRTSAAVAVTGFFLLSGCATMAGTVQARAAVDFGCNESAVQVAELPGNAFRATGCGQEASYSCTPPPPERAGFTCTREAASAK